MIFGNIDFANALRAQGNKTAEFVLEAGSVIFEAKDGAYDPEGTEDFLKR